jgi:two-component system, sensor histidine kinase and response regulator
MKHACLTLLFVLAVRAVFAQPQIDSLLSQLDEKEPVKLNSQLYGLVEHKMLRRINPDHRTWPDLTASIANQAVEKAKKFDEPAQAIVSAHMAEVLARSKQVAMGYSFINSALRKSSRLDGKTKAYVYYKYAEIFRLLNRLDSAVFYAERVIDIARDIKNDSIEKSSLDQVAMLCYSLRRNERAEYYFKQLIVHPLSTDHQRRNYFNTIALTFQRRQLYDSAVQNFSRALSYVSKNDLAWMGLLHGNIGYTYYLEKKYDKALPGLLLDVDYSFRSNSTYSALNALTTVTSIYIIKRDIAKAKLFYDSLSHQMAPDTEKSMMLGFYKLSANYFKARGELSRSVQFLESYIALDDSVRNLQNIARGSELDAQFDFDRQVKKIVALEMQSQLQTDENKQKSYLLLGTSVFLLLGAGLVYVLFRNNRFKNITNEVLKDQNKRIREQAASLNELNTTKDKIFSIIGHDLRGPINSLKGLMDMVKKGIVSQDEFGQFSEQLHSNVEYVQFTLDNLLLWSKSQLHGIQARPKPIQLNELVEDNINLLGEPAKQKEIKLVNDITATGVYADPDQISLVLRNLISNAIKFTNPGGCVTLTSESREGHEYITVRDNGMGISSELCENLFKVNSNHSTSGTEGEKGTGLGLSLCKEMVEQNKGSIGVNSEVGIGTAFTFSLPKRDS